MNPNWLQKSIKDAKEALNKVSDWSRGMSSVAPFDTRRIKNAPKYKVVYELTIKKEFADCAETFLLIDLDLAEATKQEFMSKGYALVALFPRNVYLESPLYK